MILVGSFCANDIIAGIFSFSLLFFSRLVSLYATFSRTSSSHLAIRLVSQSRCFPPTESYTHLPTTIPLQTYPSSRFIVSSSLSPGLYSTCVKWNIYLLYDPRWSLFFSLHSLYIPFSPKDFTLNEFLITLHRF